ncbi:MAG TPA: response regulator [Polyangiaceae bacterium]|jgi:two-component system response regulator MprA
MAVAGHSVILVVEDEEESRETLRELLELEGYVVQTAANGQEALDKLNFIEPCIILLDLFMPVMDGWQVLDNLRADGRLKRINVVVTTSAASNTPTDVRVLVKPLDLDNLMRTVDAVC